MPSTRRKGNAPDLFEGVSTSKSPEQRRFVLPNDLAGAVRHLDDDQLDTLLQTVTAEVRRRGKTPATRQSEQVPKKKPKEPVQIPRGQANLIRAAIKAGVKPGAIARQLRISPSVVQRVLKGKPGG